jgi:hypothetical protein
MPHRAEALLACAIALSTVACSSGSSGGTPPATGDSAIGGDSAKGEVGVDAPVARNGDRPAVTWAKVVTIGGPRGLVRDATGRLIVGEFPANGGTVVANVDLFDPDGNLVWRAAADGESFAANANGESMTGALPQLTSSTWAIDVARIDGAGKTRWQKRLGSEVGIHFGTVALADDGTAYFSGNFTKPLDFGAGPVTTTKGDEEFIAKMAIDGTPTWVMQLPNVSSSLVLVADATSNLVIAGVAKGEDLGGGPLTGTFLASITPDRAHRWSFVGTTQSAGIIDLALDGTGGGAVVLTGKGLSAFGATTFDALGDRDAVLVRFDPAGKLGWARRIATSEFGNARVAFASGGDVILAFSAGGDVDLGTGPLSRGELTYLDSAFLARYDASGKPKWAARYGNHRCDIGGVAVDEAGGIYLAGRFDTDLDLGGTSLTGKLGTVFLAKLAP